jgi:beta-phosphoglucomutase
LISEIRSCNCAAIEIPPGFVVFCDLDGTLVDTDYANYLAYRRAVIEATYGAYDLEFADERINRDSLRKQLPSLTPVQIEAVTTLKAEYFNEFLSSTRLNTELAQLITKHQKINTMVLVTCSRQKRAMEIIKYYKLAECFSRFICWEMLPQSDTKNKYENAIRLTGVNKNFVVIFENDNLDVERAMLAGVPRNNIYRTILRMG